MAELGEAQGRAWCGNVNGCQSMRLPRRAPRPPINLQKSPKPLACKSAAL